MYLTHLKYLLLPLKEVCCADIPLVQQDKENTQVELALGRNLRCSGAALRWLDTYAAASSSSSFCFGFLKITTDDR